jgi:hypothetical protein
LKHKKPPFLGYLKTISMTKNSKFVMGKADLDGFWRFFSFFGFLLDISCESMAYS